MRKFCLIRFPLHVPILTDYLLIVSRKKTGLDLYFKKQFPIIKPETLGNK